MEKFVIQGGVPLSGELTAAGNKNAALPILAACLLTEEELLLHRVPRIRDTEAQIALLERLGVEAAWVADNSLRLCAAGVGDVAVDEELSKKIRASFLLAGPLLARFGAAKMPPPGGDFIGRRRLDAHLDAFLDLGARVDGDRWIELEAPSGGLRACEIFMDEPSVMGTENALMAAALTSGPTTIANAACEPHVQDLARLLTKMGATVDGIGSNVMTVRGRDRRGGAERSVAMGARITLCDPHRAIVSGPSRLHGERVESPDIRAGMAMLIAALAADGVSEIGNIRQIDRGYEQIDERLRGLGAQIERVSAEIPA